MDERRASACPSLFHHLLDTRRATTGPIVVSPYLFWTTFAGRPASPPSAPSCGPACTTSPTPASSCSSRCSPASAGSGCRPSPSSSCSTSSLARRTRPPRSSARASRCPSATTPSGFRRPPRPGRPPVRALRRPPRGGQGLGAPARRVRRRGPQGGPRPHARHLRRGRGRTRPPTSPTGSIDLGFLADRDRDDAFAAAAAYLQPSALESFSRTVMEAWLAGTPVIANGASDVVRWHCDRSPAPASLRRRRRAGAVPALRRRGARRGRRPGRARAATTCSTTTPGRPRSTAWKPASTMVARHDRRAPRADPRRLAVPARPRRHRRLRRAAGPRPCGAAATTSRCCSPCPSAAHHHLDLQGPAGAAGAGRLMAGLRPGHRPLPPRRLLPATRPRPTSRISTGTGARRGVPSRAAGRDPAPRGRPPLGVGRRAGRGSSRRARGHPASMLRRAADRVPGRRRDHRPRARARSA